MQKRREKQMLREERRLAKKEAEKVDIPDDPFDDPTIDWGAAVREGQNMAMEDEETAEETEEQDES